jgi:predicted kinase
VEYVANTTYSNLTVLRCTVAPEVAVARIAARDSISDADEMVAAQMSRAETAWPGAVTVDTGGTAAASLETAITTILNPRTGTSAGR